MRGFPLFSGERPRQMPTASRCVRSEVICKGPVHVMNNNCTRRRCHSELCPGLPGRGKGQFKDPLWPQEVRANPALVGLQGRGQQAEVVAGASEGPSGQSPVLGCQGPAGGHLFQAFLGFGAGWGEWG